jgi:hypothetical protein
MADLFEIELADGIPVEGDGSVKTINALMEDGALATIGHKADLPVAATDATEASEIALLKMLSMVLQSLRADWPDALGTGGGLKVEGSGTPLAVTGNLTVTQVAGAGSVAAFNSGTTAYLANAVVGGVLQFVAFAVGATTMQMLSASLEIDRAAIISGETTYRLYLYSATPPSALADAAIFDLPAGDRAVFLGYIDFGTPLDLGSTLYVETNNLNKVIKTTGTNIFGYLVTAGAYMPVASAFKVKLGACQL